MMDELVSGHWTIENTRLVIESSPFSVYLLSGEFAKLLGAKALFG